MIRLLDEMPRTAYATCTWQTGATRTTGCVSTWHPAEHAPAQRIYRNQLYANWSCNGSLLKLDTDELIRSLLFLNLGHDQLSDEINVFLVPAYQLATRSTVFSLHCGQRRFKLVSSPSAKNKAH
jgi:hypothetical protein